LIYGNLVAKKHKNKSPYAQLICKFRKNFWSMQAILQKISE